MAIEGTKSSTTSMAPVIDNRPPSAQPAGVNTSALSAASNPNSTMEDKLKMKKIDTSTLTASITEGDSSVSSFNENIEDQAKQKLVGSGKAERNQGLFLQVAGIIHSVVGAILTPFFPPIGLAVIGVGLALGAAGTARQSQGSKIQGDVVADSKKQGSRMQEIVQEKQSNIIAQNSKPSSAVASTLEAGQS